MLWKKPERPIFDSNFLFKLQTFYPWNIKQWFKASRNFSAYHGTVSDDDGDFWYKTTMKNGSNKNKIMKNEFFENKSSKNEVLYSDMDLHGTDASATFTEVL